MSELHHPDVEPQKIQRIDAEYLAGRRFPYQEDISLVADVDLMAATPGQDLNWLEDVELLEEEGTPAVFDRYSNSFLKIYFPIPAGRENEIARKVLIKHLQSGNSYGIPSRSATASSPSPSSARGSRTRGPSAPTGSPPCSRAGSHRCTELRRRSSLSSKEACTSSGNGTHASLIEPADCTVVSCARQRSIWMR